MHTPGDDAVPIDLGPADASAADSEESRVEVYVTTDTSAAPHKADEPRLYVMYDAAETEISALALDARGNLYAGTAQSVGDEMQGLEQPADEKTGRREADQPGGQPLRVRSLRTLAVLKFTRGVYPLQIVRAMGL